MFFLNENPIKGIQRKPTIGKNKIVVKKSNQVGKTNEKSIKREKIIKINNPTNIEHQINQMYHANQNNAKKIDTINYFFVRLYFDSQNNSYLALQNNIWEFLNFIHSKIEKSFVLDPNNIQTFYSSSDNQVRVKIYYRDLNIKRIFINTCSNLFSNINFFIKNTTNFVNITNNFHIDTIKVTNESEKNVLGIFENDTFIIPDIPIEENIDNPGILEDDLDIGLDIDLDIDPNVDLDVDIENIPDFSIDEYEDEDDIIINIHNDKPPIKTTTGYDFVIIGGSPGGIMTAYTLATEYIDKKILIVESNTNTLDNYKKEKYNNTTKWWEASNDNNYKNTFTDVDNNVISQGEGLGGGSLHFGLQYIDHYDLVDLDYADWHKEFVQLSNILHPQTYKYGISENNTFPSKAHFDLLSELSKSQEMITYNNKIYSDNLSTDSRILYGNLLSNLKNVDVKYDTKIKNINFANNIATSCQTYDGEIIYGDYFIMSAGAIQTPVILQNSNIECGNQIFDHGGFTLLYDKLVDETTIETKNVVKGYSEDEMQNLDIPLLTFKNVKEMNTKLKMVAIINHTKLADGEIKKASDGKLPSYNIKLDEPNSIKYIYDMGTFWLPRKGHPGGSLTKNLVENEYDLTSTLLGRHGQSYSRLFLGTPPAKLIGVLTIPETISKEIKIPTNDIGFNNNKIVPHLQTHDINHKWQTYYSYLPNLMNKMIVTHAQCKNLPKTGYVKTSGNSDQRPLVKLDHLGNVKQRELTLNYLYDAYVKNNVQLEQIGYIYNGPKITKSFIEKSINSIYHYHGTCPIGDVVDKNHKVNDTNNLYIADCSILSRPWPGSTSVPAAVSGIVTANKIINKINNPILEWVNSHEYSGITYNIVMKCLNKWRSVITNVPTNKPIQFTFSLSNDLEPNVLGAASITKYIIKDTLEIKELNEDNYYNDLKNRSVREVFPYSGNIILNKKIWNSKINKVDKYNNSSVYYTLLHELGHLLGIGPLWILYGVLLYDDKTEDFFYGGENGNREYKNLFPDLNVSYMPLENDGGAGTAIVHPEEGHEEGASKNNRYFNGIFHPGLDTELMTGWAERGEDVINLPLSRVTIGMIEDIGYSVDYDAADKFIINYKKK